MPWSCRVSVNLNVQVSLMESKWGVRTTEDDHLVSSPDRRLTFYLFTRVCGGEEVRYGRAAAQGRRKARSCSFAVLGGRKRSVPKRARASMKTGGYKARLMWNLRYNPKRIRRVKSRMIKVLGSKVYMMVRRSEPAERNVWENVGGFDRSQD